MLVNSFDLFLFDLDGLLVNTEPLHYRCYQEAFQERKEHLPVDFDEYCRLAHTQLQNGLEIYTSDFSAVKKIKKRLYLQALRNAPVEMMQGAKEFLFDVKEKGKTVCVVTNSALEEFQLLQNKVEGLDTISNVITRDDVRIGKPSPEGYLKAVERFGKKEDRVIGFEDTPKGIEALIQAGIQPVLIAQKNYFAIEEAKKKGAWHFDSFSSISSNVLS